MPAPSGVGGRPAVGTPPREPAGPPLLRLAGAGIERRASHDDYFFDARFRTDPPHVVMQLTLAGEGFHEPLDPDGRARGATPLPVGTTLIDLIPGRFRYGYPPGGRGTYEYVFVGLAGDLARRLALDLIARHGNVLPLGRGTDLETQLLAIARRRDAAEENPFQTSARLYGLMMATCSALAAHRLATSPLLSRALAAVSAAGHDARFDVGALAATLGCSREHLARQFARVLGHSPAEHIARHRIRLAARQLRGGQDKLDVVARNSGFASANYLCRAFKARVGVTPTQFRQRPWMSVG